MSIPWLAMDGMSRWVSVFEYLAFSP